ncbi:MAG: hypothetical protein QM608_20980 [Caulobacter sp.]
MSEQIPPARRDLEAGADYLLRSAGLLWSVFDGDVLRGLVFLALLRLGGEDGRPVRLTAVAKSLRMPIETTRRHLLKLERAGFVARTSNGAVEARLLDRPDVREALAANSANLALLTAAVAPCS